MLKRLQTQCSYTAFQLSYTRLNTDPALLSIFRKLYNHKCVNIDNMSLIVHLTVASSVLSRPGGSRYPRRPWRNRRQFRYIGQHYLISRRLCRAAMRCRGSHSPREFTIIFAHHLNANAARLFCTQLYFFHFHFSES